jgi:hypothetical protein
MKINKYLWLILAVFSPFLFADGPNYYQDIRPIIEKNCLSCHADTKVSFSFEDPEKAFVFHAAMNSAVQDRRMPPWLAAPGVEKYQQDISLSEDEIKLFRQWANAGYAKGVDKKAPIVKSKQVESFSSNLLLNITKAAYLPNQKNKDDYRCFLTDWPEEEDLYVTGFKASPGNLKVMHHLVLYTASPDTVDMLKYLDGLDSKEGYQCYGGALPDMLGDKKTKEEFEHKYPDGVKQLQDNNFWLAQWAPGTFGYEFPKNTGVPIKKGSILIAQMHYYSGFAPGEKDSNGKMEFKLSQHIDKPALVIQVTNNDWFNRPEENEMTIASGEVKTLSVGASLDEISNYIAKNINLDKSKIKNLELHSVNLHMHAYGASGKTYLKPDNKDPQLLLSVPNWDLDWQRDFLFTQAKIFPVNTLKQNHLFVECTFKNYSDKTVYGGLGSDDEMCFNFSYVALDLD